jgi:DNA-binding protein HU-beta
MNKQELISLISGKTGLTKTDAKKGLDATVEAVSEALKAGDRISLVGFGSFSVSERGSRSGRNPKTGKEIMIPAKKIVKFRPGADLSDGL